MRSQSGGIMKATADQEVNASIAISIWKFALRIKPQVLPQLVVLVLTTGCTVGPDFTVPIVAGGEVQRFAHGRRTLH
jgi:hypothetical protein